MNLSTLYKIYANRIPTIKIITSIIIIFLCTVKITIAENFDNTTNWYYTIYCEEWDCTLYNSGIDTNYCMINELCPQEWSGFERSAIYINDIQHEWNDIINITIPEEIQREYTNNESWLNIDIVWYWYDTEKMQKMINTQHYTPTGEEMSQLVGKIADFLPLIAVALLIIRIRRVLKKVFRF